MTVVSVGEPARKLRLFVVDDRALPRLAVRAMIKDLPNLTLVGEAASGAEAIDLIPAAKPDVVLMDVEMSPMDGAEATRRVVASWPDLVVVAWTVSESTDDLLRMFSSGCVGYVLKDVGPMELERAVVAAVRKDTPVPRRMLADVLQRAAGSARPPPTKTVHLTQREQVVLRLLARGTPTKQMSRDLGIARSSVDTHLTSIYRKLGVRNRGEAVGTALRLGLISLPDL